MKKRKVIGVSPKLHSDLSNWAQSVGLPMTVVLETLLAHADTIDWEQEMKDYEERKPTWSNIRRIVQEYQVKYPDADDSKLSELTGFSVAQVETVTHTAHKRCIAFMTENPRCREKTIAKECGVSIAFATRIMEHFADPSKAPKAERYLYRL